MLYFPSFALASFTFFSLLIPVLFSLSVSFPFFLPSHLSPISILPSPMYFLQFFSPFTPFISSPVLSYAFFFQVEIAVSVSEGMQSLECHSSFICFQLYKICLLRMAVTLIATGYKAVDKMHILHTSGITYIFRLSNKKLQNV